MFAGRPTGVQGRRVGWMLKSYDADDTGGANVGKSDHIYCVWV